MTNLVFAKETQDTLMAYAWSLLSKWNVLAAQVNADDLLQMTLERILERGMSDEVESVSFLKKTMYRIAVDISRKPGSKARSLDDPAHDDLQEGTNPSIEPHSKDPNNEARHNATNQLKHWVRETRQILDELSKAPQGREQTDRYAVLICDIRFTLASRVGAAASDNEEGVSATVEKLLPWTDTDGERRFKPSFPSLLKIWLKSRDIVEEPPFHLEAKDLCAIIEALDEQGDRVSIELDPALWYQWIRRAWAWAEKQSDEGDWDETLAPFRKTK